MNDGRKREGGKGEQVVGFRVGFSHHALLFVVGTESESDKKSGDSMRVQRFHVRAAFLVIEHVEDSVIEFLAGDWTIPNENRSGNGDDDDRKGFSYIQAAFS